MSLRAVCVLKGDVTGTVYFDQRDEKSPVVVSGEVKGLSQGKHGFHIHEFGDNSNGCTSAGAHFNPKNQEHGSPDSTTRHVGDLGNIVSAGGTTKVSIQDSQISLAGVHSVLGRSLVVHADADDLGLTAHALSKSTGNAGARVACGVCIRDSLISLAGPHSIVGRTLVLRRGADDLGLGGHELSKLNGNAGGSIAFGVYIKDDQISLLGQHSIVGRSLVLHADPDDLGIGGHELSKTTGNAGARIACGVIGIGKA